MTKLKMMTTLELLEAALIGLDVQKLTLEAHILQLHQMLDGATPRKPVVLARKWEAVADGKWKETTPRKKNKRRLSAAGRKAISEASKRRWAAVRKAKGRR